MESNPLIYTKKFKVRGHDVNSDRYLTIPMLLKNMQECSLRHAMELKTSVWDLDEEKISWVLIRKELKILSPLKMGDEYTIITYPSGFDKFFAYRDFLVFNSDKKLVSAASSTWTLINTESRKLTVIPKKILEIGCPKDIRFLTQATKKVDIPSTMEKVDQRKLRAYDLDWNDHVNNIVLSRFMIEPLKEIGIEDHKFNNILFHFKNEVLKGESVIVNHSEVNGEHFISLISDGGKIIAISKVNLDYQTD